LKAKQTKFFTKFQHPSMSCILEIKVGSSISLLLDNV
jgi:hypothetical protein